MARHHRRSRPPGALSSLVLAAALSTTTSALDPEPEMYTMAAVRRPVEIAMDDRGVPSIVTSDRLDAMAALGWLHGRDRFFQMDGFRRQAAGEQAALAGPSMIELDRPRALARRRDLAQRSVESMNADERAVLDAYTRGVNAGLASLAEPPIEYRLLNATPEPWRAEDSVLVVLSMFDLLQRSADEEPGIAALRSSVPEPVAEWLTSIPGRWDALLVAPDRPESVPRLPQPLPPRREARSRLDPRELAAAIDVPADLRPGSNNFAVAGTRTPDGRAIVANDPHLMAMAPTIWYRAGLAWPGVRAAGVTLPGVPGLPIGVTEHLAWGLTNTTGDFHELVLVDVDPADPDRYLGPDGPEPFDNQDVTIKVAGGRPVTLRSRHTRWGPLIDRALDGRPIALLSACDQPGAIDLGLLGLLEARNVDEGLDVAAAWGGPSQNVVVGDADGRIGWTISGWLPDRRGWDGRSPVTHVDGRGWFGPLPESARPRVVDPPCGSLQTANNRLVPIASADRIGRCWADGGRAWRIRERLAALDSVTESDLVDIQLDQFVQRFVPYRDLLLEDLATAEGVDGADEVRAIVEGWDGRASADARALPLVSSFRTRLLRDVKAMLLTRFATRPLDPDTAEAAATAITEEPVLLACESRDERLLPSGGDWAGTIRTATLAAIASHRNDPDTNWAIRNRLVARHPLGGAHPLVGERFDLPSVPQPGHWGAVRVQAPRFGASTRFVASPGRFDDASIQIPGGQSGDPRSPHYADALEDWAAGTPTPLVPGTVARTLELRPTETRASP